MVAFKFMLRYSQIINMKKVILIIALIVNMSPGYSQITRLEYFWDEDPGFGNATQLSFTPETTVISNFTIDVSSLSPGIHSMFLRAKDDDGNWSLYTKHNIFVVSGMSARPNITQLEYFWDADPGLGNATQLSFTPGTTVISNFTIDVSSLSPGIHSMFLRAKDGYGNWSVYIKHNIFVVSGMSATPNIIQLEYFWDTDPGIGLANPLSCSQPNQTIQEDFQISLANLLAGDHYLYIRAKDSYGKWSLYSKDTVNISDQLPSNINVQNVTISNGQTKCYNAADTIIVAGSGTTVDILLGSEVKFIAGKKILFKPGFTARPGSYVNAYITTTGEYCESLSPMIPNTAITLAEPDDIIFKDGDSETRLYPNPTSGKLTIDFIGKPTTAEIIVFDMQGDKLIELSCRGQLKQEMDIGHLQMGLYIVVIKTQEKIITRKVIKNYW